MGRSRMGEPDTCTCSQHPFKQALLLLKVPDYYKDMLGFIMRSNEIHCGVSQQQWDITLKATVHTCNYSRV